jgi:hypothetical protein
MEFKTGGVYKVVGNSRYGEPHRFNNGDLVTIQELFRDQAYVYDTREMRDLVALRDLEEINKKVEFDLITKPAHYNTGKIEVMDFIEDQKLGFCDGNVVKYICRFRHKGEPIKDLKKAHFYLSKLITKMEREEKENLGAK